MSGAFFMYKMARPYLAFQILFVYSLSNVYAHAFICFTQEHSL